MTSNDLAGRRLVIVTMGDLNVRLRDIDTGEIFRMDRADFDRLAEMGAVTKVSDA